MIGHASTWFLISIRNQLSGKRAGSRDQLTDFLPCGRELRTWDGKDGSHARSLAIRLDLQRTTKLPQALSHSAQPNAAVN